MKKYVVPEMVCVDLRAEERVCECSYEPGDCHYDNGDSFSVWVGQNS